jgi:cobalt/nickel transport system permease protein
MWLDALERHAEGDGPLHRLDPRVKLLATLGFVLLVVATPLGRWRLLAVEGLTLALVVGLSGLSPRALLGRWLGFVVLVGFFAAMIALSRPAGERLGVAASVLARNSLAFLAVLTLAGVTPFPGLLGGLRRLGAPAVLVATLHFMYRYLYVLTDELDRMAKARRSRTFRRSGRLDWGLLTGLIGVLFDRTLERGERVHAAMTARGWDGTIRTLDGADV